MTYAELVKRFLDKVQEIKNKNPAYRQPGDGSDGTCDCIGLLIGALRRMGLKWSGIHGSNYAARYETVGLEQTHGEKSLALGDAVYKAYAPGDRGYNLPDRYKKGRPYYNGNLLDYYHVGTVTGVNPLRITHMTSPHMKVDTAVGKWGWHGKLKPLVEAAEKGTVPEEAPAVKPSLPEPPAAVPDGNAPCRAIVYAENGKPVKMREYPSTTCRTWDSLPVGTEVTITEPGEEWAKINGGRRKGWYMMSKFLDVVGDGKGRY